MANFYGTGRSNYVEVTDVEKFKSLCKKFDLEFITEKQGKKTKVGFLTNSEDGDLPYDIYDEDTEDMIEVEPLIEFSHLLKDEEVLVFQFAGAEKHRYITGSSIAINNKQETVRVDLNDILTKAESLGKNITSCEY